MPPAVIHRKERPATADRRRLPAVALLVALQLAAAGLLIWSEADLAARVAFALTWGLLNFFWLVLLRRPLTAAVLSLGLIVILILLSQFKHAVLMMTATFVDVMIIDLATVSFLLAIIPGLAWKVGLALMLAIPALLAAWRADPFRVPRGRALLGCMGCLGTLTVLSFAFPLDREDEFYPHQYVSKFVRSASVATVDLIAHGVLEADAAGAGRLFLGRGGACDAGRKRPHIVMVFDESSFDVTMLPNVEVPADYRARFRSSDAKARSFVVEGAGGPSWYTEYNVLTGLSVRSYGRFAESVTRLATGRVKRGLPHALRECGYKTYSLYSWFGGFAGARGFQTTTGIEHFLDAKQLGSGAADTDRFYYDHAARIIAEQRDNGPVFVFVYLAVNHFPWNYRYRPDLLPGWVNPGNPFEIDEYLRRQELSAHDYGQFKQRLGRELPDDQVLLVRFGDHQPLFAKRFLDPTLDQAAVAERILARDPRYFTTYYAIEGVNFRPLDLSSALDTLDAPYLPLVVMEGAGVPLDATFVEQKRILNRCHGLFYLCAGGAEARRFNRLLIDAGLIQGL
ncbi:MAG TPA: sulfatase-like hydrolase/transferase [Xanthobacteraceae bacterium]|nr:sulfatase-like hydrolase/transferase [Xanthobacteraceae bacterium]